LARRKEEKKETSRTDRPSPWSQPGRWATKEAALKGVPAKENEEFFKDPEGCWRCGQRGHRTYECFARTTRHGTTLPRAPWKAAGATTAETGKRKRSEETNETPGAKQQKIAAVETMEDGPRALPIWADDSDQSDF